MTHFIGANQPPKGHGLSRTAPHYRPGAGGQGWVYLYTRHIISYTRHITTPRHLQKITLQTDSIHLAGANQGGDGKGQEPEHLRRGQVSNHIESSWGL